MVMNQVPVHCFAWIRPYASSAAFRRALLGWRASGIARFQNSKNKVFAVKGKYIANRRSVFPLFAGQPHVLFRKGKPEVCTCFSDTLAARLDTSSLG